LGGARHAQGPRAARAGERVSENHRDDFAKRRLAEHARTARACRGWAQDDLPFEDDSLPTGALRRRLLDRKQQLFYNNALTAPLALGTIESLALP
jgi:hypothetical protein